MVGRNEVCKAKRFGTQEITVNLYKQNTTPPEYIVQVSNIKQLFKFSDSFANNIYKKKKDFIPEPEKKKDEKKK